MHHRHGRSLLAAVAALCWANQSFAQISAVDEAKLVRGEVATQLIQQRGPGGRLIAIIDIPAPTNVVWKVMLDCARAPAYIPGLDGCRIIEAGRDGRSDIREHRLHWLSILPAMTVRFASDYLPEREIRVRRVSGDLAAMSGVWTLEARDNGRATRLHYDFTLVPNSFLPSGLVRAGLMRDTPKVLKAVRTEVIRVAGL